MKGWELRRRWPSSVSSSRIARSSLHGLSVTSAIHSTSQAFGTSPVRFIQRSRFSTAIRIRLGLASTFATMSFARSSERRSISGWPSPTVPPRPMRCVGNTGARGVVIAVLSRRCS